MLNFFIINENLSYFYDLFSLNNLLYIYIINKYIFKLNLIYYNYIFIVIMIYTTIYNKYLLIEFKYFILYIYNYILILFKNIVGMFYENFNYTAMELVKHIFLNLLIRLIEINKEEERYKYRKKYISFQFIDFFF